MTSYLNPVDMRPYTGTKRCRIESQQPPYPGPASQRSNDTYYSPPDLSIMEPSPPPHKRARVEQSSSVPVASSPHCNLRTAWRVGRLSTDTISKTGEKCRSSFSPFSQHQSPSFLSENYSVVTEELSPIGPFTDIFGDTIPSLINLFLDSDTKGSDNEFAEEFLTPPVASAPPDNLDLACDGVTRNFETGQPGIWRPEVEDNEQDVQVTMVNATEPGRPTSQQRQEQQLSLFCQKQASATLLAKDHFLTMEDRLKSGHFRFSPALLDYLVEPVDLRFNGVYGQNRLLWSDVDEGERMEYAKKMLELVDVKAWVVKGAIFSHYDAMVTHLSAAYTPTAPRPSEWSGGSVDPSPFTKRLEILLVCNIDQAPFATLCQKLKSKLYLAMYLRMDRDSSLPLNSSSGQISIEAGSLRLVTESGTAVTEAHDLQFPNSPTWSLKSSWRCFLSLALETLGEQSSSEAMAALMSSTFDWNFGDISVTFLEPCFTNANILPPTFAVGLEEVVKYYFIDNRLKSEQRRRSLSPDVMLN